MTIRQLHMLCRWHIHALDPFILLQDFVRDEAGLLGQRYLRVTLTMLDLFLGQELQEDPLPSLHLQMISDT